MSNSDNSVIENVGLHKDYTVKKKGGLLIWISYLFFVLVAIVGLNSLYAWFIAIPVLIVTFVFSIILMSRSRVLAGLIILLMTLIVMPLYLVLTSFVICSQMDWGSSLLKHIDYNTSVSVQEVTPEGTLVHQTDKRVLRGKNGEKIESQHQFSRIIPHQLPQVNKKMSKLPAMNNQDDSSPSLNKDMKESNLHKTSDSFQSSSEDDSYDMM